jgi:hypothetical protein
MVISFYISFNALGKGRGLKCVLLFRARSEERKIAKFFGLMMMMMMMMMISVE